MGIFTILRAKLKLYKMTTITVLTAKINAILVCVHSERKDFPLTVPIEVARVAPEHSG